MQIELFIDGEKKLFSAPYVPMMAKRKYIELLAKAEEKMKEMGEDYLPTSEEQLAEDDAMMGILSDIVFNRQFTLEQLYLGASDQYNYTKLREAIFGKKPKNEGTEKNNQGE